MSATIQTLVKKKKKCNSESWSYHCNFYQVIARTVNSRWTTPIADNLKQNSDASIFPIFGVVVKNTQGSVTRAAANSLSRCGEPEEVEVLACLQV
jgi:hypothetical protein